MKYTIEHIWFTRNHPFPQGAIFTDKVLKFHGDGKHCINNSSFMHEAILVANVMFADFFYHKRKVGGKKWK